jgi:hypothetical protein
MSYSRRQLEAFGEPLGESVTRKEAGRVVYGGGGSSSSTGTQTQITELPEWARGYAKSALEKSAALSEKPYQAYGGERIAGFSPLQIGAQNAAANMQTSAATGEATNRALNTQYDPYATGQFGAQASQYMDPYMQNVVNIQQREAQRQADIAGTQRGAQAVGAGAFGGSRQAIMDAEAARNLSTQKGDIQARGLQDAYGRGQNQFNTEQQLREQSRQYGAGLGMQGLQTALQGAGQQFQQGMDINKLQSAYGGQQQALRQQGLSQAYEDFQNQQNYPYKQLGFFSDMIRGLPVGQTSAKNIYEPEPGLAQQVGSIGMGAYGLSKFMAEGGRAYADGGSVDSADNVQRIVSKLSDQQLQQAAQAAQARGDMDQLEAIQSEMAMRASERNGIAGGVTNEMADRMAGGGVVAFAGGGLNEYMKNIVDASKEDISETPEERLAGIKSALPGIKSLYGDSAMKPFMEELKKDRENLGTQKTQGEGLAWLAGAEALVRPGSKSRALAGSLAAVGTNLAKANKDFTDANTKLRQSEMTLAAADQARTDGQIGKAESLYDKGRNDQKDALKRKMDANKDLATIQASVDNSIRSTNASMAQINKPGETERMLADLDLIRSGKKSFQGLTGEKGAQAYQDSVAALGAAKYGVKYTGPNKDFEHKNAVLERLQKDEGVKIAQMKVAQLETKTDRTPKEQAVLDANNAFLKKRFNEVSAELKSSGAPAGGTPAGGKVITMADIVKTAQSSNRSVEEVRAAAAAKGYTIQ